MRIWEILKSNLSDSEKLNALKSGLDEFSTVNLTNHSLELNHITLLCEALKTNRTVVGLSLSRTHLDDNTVGAFAEVLEQNSTLTELNLASNFLSYKGLLKLQSSLSNNRTLKRLAINQEDNENGPNSAAVMAVILENNKSLEHLAFSASKIGDKGIKTLCEGLNKNHTLKGLYIETNRISETGAKSLAIELKTNNTLEHLNLSFNLIKDEGAKAIAESLKQNKKLLSLSLSLRKTGITDSGVVAIAEALKGNTALTYLDLTDNADLTNAGVKALSEALALKKTSTKLDLHLAYNGLNEQDAQSLAKMLAQNPSVNALNLQGNSLGDNGVEKIINALIHNTQLKSLNLGINNIGDNGFKAIAKALKNNTSLSSLTLWDNTKVTSQGLQSLFSMLGTNKGLSKLNLLYNKLSDADIEALSIALVQNTTLSTLTLHGATASNAGLKLLFNSLTLNNTLTSVNLLNGSELEDPEIAKALADALEKNITLTHFPFIEYPSIPKESLNRIYQYLERNQKLAFVKTRGAAAPVVIHTAEPSVTQSQDAHIDPSFIVPNPTATSTPSSTTSAPETTTEKNTSLLSKVGTWLRKQWNKIRAFFSNLSFSKKDTTDTNLNRSEGANKTTPPKTASTISVDNNSALTLQQTPTTEGLLLPLLSMKTIKIGLVIRRNRSPHMPTCHDLFLSVPHFFRSLSLPNAYLPWLDQGIQFL